MADRATIMAKAGAATMSQPPSRMRVLHVIPTLGPGGSERFLLDLLNNLDRSRFETHVCVLGSLNAFPGRLPAASPVTFLNRSSALSSPVEIVAVVAGLRRLIARFKPHIVHSHLWHAIRPAALATFGTQLPHIAHLHEAWARLASKTLRDRAMRRVTNRLLAREPTRFIAVSRETGAYIACHVPCATGRIQVIANGVDLSKFDAGGKAPEARGKEGCVVIAMAARLEKDKGQELLIRAAAELIGHGHDVELRFAGIGKMRDRYLALAQQLGIANRTRFLGLVEDMPDFYRRADVFVLPSATEGMPLTVLEAMAMGLPVVASAVGGIPEIIDDGRNGLLIEELTASTLAQRLVPLLTDADLRHRLRQAAIETVKTRFSLAETARKVGDVYETQVSPHELHFGVHRGLNR